MNIDDTIKTFDRLEQMIRRELPVFIQQRLAHDAVAMIQNRVVNTQKDYLGRAFGNYSTRPMLTSGNTEKSNRVWRAMAGSRSKRKTLKWVTLKAGGRNVRLFELPQGYAQLRRLEGFRNTRKNFEFTTQMWRGFGIKKIVTTGSEVTVTIGGRTPESQRKIDVNSRREGVSIVNISDKELDILAKMVDAELQKYIQKVGLS